MSKKILKLIVLIIVIFSITLSGYLFYHKIYLKNDCTKNGGRWQQSALGFFCNMPAGDAGKFCTDSDQCESRACVAAGINTGMCYEWKSTVTTCLSLIEDGKIVSAVCSD